MIYIKDKQKRTVINIPRLGEVLPDYITEYDLQETVDSINQTIGELQEKIDLNRQLISIHRNQFLEFANDVQQNYAKKSYVNEQIGNINNVLEQILE